jgi:ferredoxin-NADP reductase
MAERGAKPKVHPVRRKALDAVRSLFSPLLPDDYLELINPLWSTQELRGRIERIEREDGDAVTILIRPGYEWQGHEPGQYLRVGVVVDGIFHWRAYSLTSDPDRPDGCLAITPKLVEEGLMSTWFTRRARPDQLVYLGAVEGEFRLPDPLPRRSLFISAGSGITPIWSMLRELERRDALADTFHVHSAREPDLAIFGDYLRRMAREYEGYTFHEQLTGATRRLVPADLDELCPDWRERDAFLSGPRDMIDPFERHWEAGGIRDRLRTERFQPIIGTGDAEVGSGGHVSFRITDFEATCDSGVSILVGGEQAGGNLPYGCRMGICHTCIGKLRSGRVRDLRTGEVHGEQGETIRTCVNAPEGEIEIDL